MAIWPNQMARVNFSLIFDQSYDPDAEMVGGLPHLLPSTVTKTIKYGVAFCANGRYCPNQRFNLMQKTFQSKSVFKIT